jgi:hypothetical protein
MQRPTSDGVTAVLGGRPANQADWPAALIFTTAGGGCTSTLVSDRVVLTAAHCVEDGSMGKVLIGVQTIDVKCTHNPSYAGNYTADYALCLLGTPVESEIVFERVNANPGRVQNESEVTLLGYGCTTEGGFDEGFGRLFEGEAKVVGRPDGEDLYFHTTGGAALCFGDSGGASYYGGAASDFRAVIAVNSRGDVSKNSYLSSTSTEAFLDWAYTWSGENGVSICGLHDGVKNCHG